MVLEGAGLDSSEVVALLGQLGIRCDEDEQLIAQGDFCELLRCHEAALRAREGLIAAAAEALGVADGLSLASDSGSERHMRRAESVAV